MANTSKNETFTARTATSFSDYQFRGVRVTSSNATVNRAQNTQPTVGVSAEDTRGTGKATPIVFSGVVKAQAGAAITAGSMVRCLNSGLFVTSTAGTHTSNYTVGIALTGAPGGGRVFDCLVINGTRGA